MPVKSHQNRAIQFELSLWVQWRLSNKCWCILKICFNADTQKSVQNRGQETVKSLCHGYTMIWNDLICCYLICLAQILASHRPTFILTSCRHLHLDIFWQVSIREAPRFSLLLIGHFSPLLSIGLASYPWALKMRRYSDQCYTLCAKISYLCLPTYCYCFIMWSFISMRFC